MNDDDNGKPIRPKSLKDTVMAKVLADKSGTTFFQWKRHEARIWAFIIVVLMALILLIRQPAANKGKPIQTKKPKRRRTAPPVESEEESPNEPPSSTTVETAETVTIASTELTTAPPVQYVPGFFLEPSGVFEAEGVSDIFPPLSPSSVGSITHRRASLTTTSATAACGIISEFFSTASAFGSSAQALWVGSLLPFFDDCQHGAVVEFDPTSAHVTVAMLHSAAGFVTSIVQNRHVLPTIKYLHLGYRSCFDHDQHGQKAPDAAAAKGTSRRSFVSGQRTALLRQRYDMVVFGSLEAMISQLEAIRHQHLQVTKYVAVVDSSGEWPVKYERIRTALLGINHLDLIFERSHFGIAVFRVSSNLNGAGAENAAALNQPPRMIGPDVFSPAVDRRIIDRLSPDKIVEFTMLRQRASKEHGGRNAELLTDWLARNGISVQRLIREIADEESLRRGDVNNVRKLDFRDDDPTEKRDNFPPLMRDADGNLVSVGEADEQRKRLAKGAREEIEIREAKQQRKAQEEYEALHPDINLAPNAFGDHPLGGAGPRVRRERAELEARILNKRLIDSRKFNYHIRKQHDIEMGRGEDYEGQKQRMERDILGDDAGGPRKPEALNDWDVRKHADKLARERREKGLPDIDAERDVSFYDKNQGVERRLLQLSDHDLRQMNIIKVGRNEPVGMDAEAKILDHCRNLFKPCIAGGCDPDLLCKNEKPLPINFDVAAWHRVHRISFPEQSYVAELLPLIYVLLGTLSPPPSHITVLGCYPSLASVSTAICGRMGGSCTSVVPSAGGKQSAPQSAYKQCNKGLDTHIRAGGVGIPVDIRSVTNVNNAVTSDHMLTTSPLIRAAMRVAQDTNSGASEDPLRPLQDWVAHLISRSNDGRSLAKDSVIVLGTRVDPLPGMLMKPGGLDYESTSVTVSGLQAASFSVKLHLGGYDEGIGLTWFVKREKPN